jgi:hypothetical protein
MSNISGAQARKDFADLIRARWPRRRVDAVVTMVCGDACPFVCAKHRIDWQTPIQDFRITQDYLSIGLRLSKLSEFDF